MLLNIVYSLQESPHQSFTTVTPSLESFMLWHVYISHTYLKLSFWGYYATYETRYGSASCVSVSVVGIICVYWYIFKTKYWFLHVSTGFSIDNSQGFNVGTSGAKIFSGSAEEQFGYTVQQFSNSQGKW